MSRFSASLAPRSSTPKPRKQPGTRTFPVFEAEHALGVLVPEGGFLVAFDEVGRGCVAGPVVAGCTLWRKGTPTETQARLLPLVDDSKALSAAKRERIAREFDVPFVALSSVEKSPEHLLQASDLVKPTAAVQRFEDVAHNTFGDRHKDAGERSAVGTTPPASFVCVAAGLGAVQADEIDALDIWTAVQLAMARALTEATAALPTPPSGRSLLFVLDGNCGVKVAPEHACVQQVTCVKGDSLFVSLGLSSILAKVARDALMTNAARAHPEYGFEKHKGYGTAAHFEALRCHSPISLHRRSFLRSLANDETHTRQVSPPPLSTSSEDSR